MPNRTVNFGLSAVIMIFSAALTAEESSSSNKGPNYPTSVYWGDTHLHTAMSSTDAYLWGNRLRPEEAYRFAKGEAVMDSNGKKVRLRRALDFLVVADHAENLGVLVSLEANAPALRNLSADRRQRLQRFWEEIERLRSSSTVAGAGATNFDLIAQVYKDRQLIPDKAFKRSVWEQVTATADRHNAPGKFTAFIGYEWSSNPRGADGTLGNLHRVVVFKDDAAKANRVVPFSSHDSEDPQALWRHLADYETQTGGAVLAIAHNGNTSNGDMFPLRTFSGQPLNRAYAEMRARWEPLYEVTQTKGTSEAHPFLSPTDEFADFEIWNSWYGKALPAGRAWNEAERTLKAGEYARAGLKRGLDLQMQLGVNPFKFGLIGSTDAHNSLSTVEENEFWGKFPRQHLGAARIGDEMGMFTHVAEERAFLRAYGIKFSFPPARELGGAGRAAVWATDNTRDALFAAMKRKEAYATTGPRMTVRFFGGWDYVPEEAQRSDLALVGYQKGVPMGGDLTQAPHGKAPRFLIHAVKDPQGANLDRVQVIKGWRDSKGELHERIYNAALSDGRKAGPDGQVPPVGNTVDIKEAAYANSIGDAELATMWTDPAFDSKEPAFYYLRVLEIPTPRWTTYDAASSKAPLARDVPTTLQERAYTSAIWYIPP